MSLPVFAVISLLIVATSLGVIVQRNPVRSALSLVATLFLLAVMYIFLAAHLLAALQIIVYAGAIMVLFTFVIMLLNLQPDEMAKTEVTPVKLIGGLFALFVFGKLLTAIGFAAAGARAVDLTADRNAAYGSVEDIARMLYTTFMVPFELISVLLLVAAVGAVMLAKKTLGPAGPAVVEGAEHAEESR